jgi:hypothetical protein
MRLAISRCEYVTAYGFFLPYEDSSYRDHDVEPSWLHSNAFDFTRRQVLFDY